MIRGMQSSSVRIKFFCVLLASILMSQEAGGGIFTAFVARSSRVIANRTEVKDGRRYVKANPSVEDLDLKKLTGRLKKFGIVLPVTLEGKVSARVLIEVPVGTLGDAKLYRLQGTVESNRVIIDGFEIRKLLANLTYRDGIAKLDQLTFQIPHEKGPSGRVSGNAALNVLPVDDLCGTLSFDDLPLSSVKELLTDIPDISGRATGRLEFCIADAELRNVDAWSASGEFKAQPFQVEQLALDRLTAKLKLVKSRLEVHEILAERQAGTFQGAANLELKAPFPVNGKASVRSANLHENLILLAPGIAQLVHEGKASAEIQFKAELDPLKYEAEGTAQIDQLVVAGRSIEHIQTELFFDKQMIHLKGFQATAFGGKLQGSVVFNHRTLETKAQAKIQGLEMSRILPTKVTNQWQLRGEANGSVSLTLPSEALDKPDEWTGLARLNVERVAFAGTTDGQLSASISLAKGMLQLKSFKGRAAGMDVDASGQIQVSKPYEYSASLNAHTPVSSQQTTLLPFGIRSRADLEVDAEGQWQPRLFEIDGKLTAENVIWNDYALEQFQIEGRATEKRISISKLQADLYGGQMIGTLEIPISPPRQPNQDAAAGEAKIEWNDVDLAEILIAKGIDAVRPGAELSGTLAANVPPGAWRTPENWVASVEAELVDLRLQNDSSVAGTAKARYSDSSLRVTEFILSSGSQSLSGTGRIATDAPYRWQTSATTKKLEIETLLPFVALPGLNELSGIVSASGEFEGSLQSTKLSGQGRVTADSLQFGTVEAEKVQFDLNADENFIAIQNAEAKILKGSVTGSAQWPWALQGPIALNADWSELSIGPLFEQFQDELPSALSKIGGRIGGVVNARLPRSKLTKPFHWEGRLEIRGTELTLDDRDIGWFTANTQIRDQAFEYSLDGEILSGTIAMEGGWSLSQEHNRGTLRAEKISMSGLLSLVDWDVLIPLQGQVNLQVQFRLGGPYMLEQASGSVSITKPSWKDTLISESLTGSMAWDESRLTVENLSGSLMRGQLRSDFGISVGAEQNATYSVLLQKADLQNAVNTWTDFGGDVNAAIDLRLKGTFGKELRGSGTLAARQVRYRFPRNRRIVNLGNWRVPIRLSYARRRLQIDSLRVSGTPFNSRSTVDMSLTIDKGIHLDGKAKYKRVNLPQLLHGLGRRGQTGRGLLSGNLSFRGRNLKSLDDLEMSVESRLQQTQAATVPLLSSLQPFLSVSVPLTEIFQTGQFRGRLKDRLFRIERFSLNGQHVNLYAFGTVTLEGRLNLDVTADTGRLTEDRLLSRSLVSQLLSVASPPVALLVRANQFVADRVVHLIATGTLRQPRIRVRPIESLSEEAIRFFLLQAVE